MSRFINRTKFAKLTQKVKAAWSHLAYLFARLLFSVNCCLFRFLFSVIFGLVLWTQASHRSHRNCNLVSEPGFPGSQSRRAAQIFHEESQLPGGPKMLQTEQQACRFAIVVADLECQRFPCGARGWMRLSIPQCPSGSCAPSSSAVAPVTILHRYSLSILRAHESRLLARLTEPRCGISSHALQIPRDHTQHPDSRMQASKVTSGLFLSKGLSSSLFQK